LIAEKMSLKGKISQERKEEKKKKCKEMKSHQKESLCSQA